jgi:arabinofuranosyltransferase
MSQTHPSHRSIQYTLLAIAVIAAGIQVFDYLNFCVDDVFITLRVALNTALGHGATYNVNEMVEGYSDPTWVALLAGFAKISSIQLPVMSLLWAAKALSVLFGLLSVITAYHFTRYLLSDSRHASLYASVTAFLMACCAPFILWSVAGLEMTFIAWLYLTMVWLSYHNIRSRSRSMFLFSCLGALWLLAALTRPEASAFVAIDMMILFIYSDRIGRVRSVVSALFFGALFGLFLAWRWNTYHDLLPNTYYAKSAAGVKDYLNGFKYIFGALGITCGPLLLLVFLPVYRSGWKKPSVLLLSSFALFQLLFAISVGGDWMPGSRFLIPVLPLVFILVVLGIRRLVESNVAPFSLSGIQIVGAGLVFALMEVFAGRMIVRAENPQLPSGLTSRNGFIADAHVELAEWLGQHARTGQIVALGEAGIIGYMNPKVRVLDLNGLMDRHIANGRYHDQPFDVPYVLSRRPVYVILWDDPRFRNRTSILESKSKDYGPALRASPFFQNQYRLIERVSGFEIYERDTTGTGST